MTATLRVSVKPELLNWACERGGLDLAAFRPRFPRLLAWVEGAAQPTLKQLEQFAKATHTPIGYFFLPQPPDEAIPIPDFRTVAGRTRVRPSPDLLETIYICQQRQEWYRDFARSMGEEALSFVGSLQITDDVVAAAKSIRKTLGFDLAAQRELHTWTDALRHFIERADDTGILVMCSGVVNNNTTRKLDPQEFRGFAMADVYAPVVFINGADSKSAQMFTLAHELAHIWLGESAVSDAEAARLPQQEVERWCNRVAAELLGLTRDELREGSPAEIKRVQSLPKGGGGNFYLTQAARVSKRFARALVVSTREGYTLHRDAFRLLGFSKHATFEQLGLRLGVG